MVSKDKDDLIVLKEIAEEKLNFSSRLIKAIKKNGSLSHLFSELKDKTLLDYLQRIGVPDARSYMNKSKQRIRAYLKVKKPALLFQKKHLSDKRACQDIMSTWSLEAIQREIKNIIISDDDKEEVNDPNSEVDESTILTTGFISAIQYLTQNEELQRACYISGCFITNPLLPMIFDSKEREDLLEKIENPSQEYLESLINKLKNHIDNKENDVETKISKLKDDYTSLAEVFLTASERLKEFNEFPPDSFNNDIEELKKNFKDLRDYIYARGKDKGFEPEEKENYNSLNDLIDLANEIEKYKIKEFDQRIEKANGILEQAEKITVNGSQKEEHLVQFFKKVNEVKQNILVNEQDIDNLLSDTHPISVLVKYVNEKYQKREGCNILQRSLEKFCGPDMATYLVFKLVMGELNTVDDIAEEGISKDSEVDITKGKDADHPDKVGEIEINDKQPLEKESDSTECDVIEEAPTIDDISDLISENIIEDQEELNKDNTPETDIESPLVDMAETLQASPLDIKKPQDKIYFEECLEKGEFRKAYWVAASCDIKMSSDLIGALALGTQIGVGSNLPSQLQGFFSKIITNSFDDISSKLLLFSSIIGSALFTAPSSNEIFTLIEFVNSGIQPIDNLMQFIKSEFLYKGITITPNDINSALGHEGKEQKLRELKERSFELLQRNSNAQFTNYVPAKILLRHLYREGSDLTKIHRIIERSKSEANSNKFNVQEIKFLLKELNGETIVATAHTLGINKVTIPIEGTATNQLIRRINDTIAIGREWYNLFADTASGSNEKILSSLHQSIKKGIDDLDNLTHAKLDETIITVTRNCLKSIQDQLDGIPAHEIVPLNHEIIGIETLVMDDEFEIESDSENCIVECFMKIPGNETEISLPIFDTFIDRREFLRANQIIDIYDLSQIYNDRLGQAFDDEQNKILKKIEELKNKVEDAYLLGRLTFKENEEKNSQEALRSILIGTIEKANENILSSNEMISWRIREIESNINQIDEQLTQMENFHNIGLIDEFSKILSQFPNSESGINDRDYVKKAFNEALNQNDNIAAFELINRAREALQKKEPFPRTDIGENEELSIFLKKLNRYQEHFGKKSNIDAAISSIRHRRKFAELNFGSIDNTHQSEALSGITAWRDLLKLNPQKSQEKLLLYLNDIADFLGLPFRKSSLLIRSAIDEDFIYVTVGLKFMIDSCPIPTFGSSLGATAHIVISQNKKEPDQLSSFFNRHELQQKPVFLFYLQEMSIQQRIIYQQFFAKKKLSVLLIDLCLAFHLSGIRNRLPALFKIALSFSWAQPYLMKGENVPQETFVGRDEEVNSIYDPNGSCIIFGGRQLGKSALLRHIYNTYNNPDKNIFIAYLDIDELGMEPQTHEQMREYFWRKVDKVLIREKFLPERVISVRKAEKIENEIIDEILNTLKNNPEKHLYLLLDETDNLLDNDSSLRFPIIRRLRGMMAATDRRFKVVLAGLQSVQRYKNWKNHPFAQLGTDVVVRPLNPEAAQKLILRPLNALGFVFEKPGLILRILSQANYHPGLIQIFCHRLVEKLYGKWGNKASERVVRTIGLDDLLLIERDPNFIEDIRNRFDWTLDLDDRYKVLIYSLVLTEDPTSSRSEREFMSLACDWWPEVFEKMDQQSLRAVLDEMDGLGVLVREDEETTRMYRLRSPNLLRLLGTREQIEDELLRITALGSPRILNSRNFHSKISEKPLVFGPMTKEQEGYIANVLNTDILQLTIISGSIALGLDCVTDQLKSIFKEMEDWNEIVPPIQYNTVQEKLISFIKEEFKIRNRLNQYVVIDLSFLQSDINISKFFNNLLKTLEKVCTKNSRGHIFLLIDPQHSWNWLSDPKREAIIQHQRVNSIELKRWSNGAITNALENIGVFAGAKDTGEDIFSFTYGWHNLIDVGLRSLKVASLKKRKNNIIMILKDHINNFSEKQKQSRADALKKYALTSEEPAIAKCMDNIFTWSHNNDEDSMIITQDTLDYLRSEDEDMSDILSDGGRKLKDWLLMNDVVYRTEENSLTVNPIAKDILLDKDINV